MDKFLEAVDTVFVSGGNRCLAGEQLIYRADTDELVPVQDVSSAFEVLAFDEAERRVVRAAAHPPFQKPVQDLYRNQLSDGTLLSCSQSHRVLSQGQWCSMSELSDYRWPDAILTETEHDDFSDLPLSDGDHLLTILDIDPLAFRAGVHRFWKIVQGSLSGCRLFVRCGDEPLRRVLGIGPDAFPSPNDVLEHIFSCGESWDDWANKLAHTRLYLLCDRPSTLDGLRQLWDQSVDILSDVSCTPCKSTSQSREGQGTSVVHQQSTVGSFRQSQSIHGFEQRGIRYYYVSSSSGIRNYFAPVVKSDYLRTDTVWDFEVDTHHNYMIGSCASHNSSKTECGARSVVKAALENPNAEIVCFAQDSDASIRVQQRAVYRYLPPEFKQKSKSQVEYLNYTVKNGFTGASFILPNGSTVYFHTYSQFQANRSKFEGLEIGSKTPKWHNIGLWLDEYLEDGDLVATMRFRLATRNSKMLMTFTPIDGHTPFVAEFLKDVETLEERYAEMVDEVVPFVQYSHHKDAGIVFFHSELNPFGGYERIKKELKNSSKEEILTRAYGIPVRSMNTLFPDFNTGVHVIKDLPAITKHTHTVYQVVDPAGARNYVAIWAAVDKLGNVTVLREWPDRDS